MIRKGFYFSSKTEKNKGDTDFKPNNVLKSLGQGRQELRWFCFFKFEPKEAMHLYSVPQPSR